MTRGILVIVLLARAASAESLVEREQRCTYDWRACDGLRFAIGGEDGAARTRYEQACSVDAPIQCAFAGDWIFEHSLSQQRELGDPSVWFRKACAAGNRYGCDRLAWLMPEKSREAFAINEDLCQRDWPSGCMFVGYRLEWSQDSRERAHALERLVRACDLGELDGCWRAGFTYAHDANAAADLKARWRDRMDVACTAGNVSSCSVLADVYRCGIGTACDARRGRIYEDKATVLSPPPPRPANGSVVGIARCECKR